MKIRILIVEDDPITGLDLKEMLMENGIEVIGVAQSADVALELINKHNPDVMLVDIMLKGNRSGIDLVNEMDGTVPFIFISANSDRVTVNQAIKARPSAFLTKPFDEREVVIAIELAFSSINYQIANDGGAPDFIFVKSGNLFEKVQLRDIQFVQADGSYCKVFTAEKEYVLTANLNSFCNSVANGALVRIHRSYAVNFQRVTGMDNDYVYIDKLNLPISRTHKSELKGLFRRFA